MGVILILHVVKDFFVSTFNNIQQFECIESNHFQCIFIPIMYDVSLKDHTFYYSGTRLITLLSSTPQK